MLKVNQVAGRLNISESKVYELVEGGKLAHHRIGGAIRVSEEQLAEFLEETKRERSADSDSKKSRASRPRLKHVRI